MKKFAFPKKFRLLDFKYCTQIIQKSQQARTKEIVVLGKINLLEYHRIGFIISKKNIKHANKRNKIKRLIRESFRLCRQKLLIMDFIVIVKKETISLSNDVFFKKLEKLWSYYYLSSQKS